MRLTSEREISVVVAPGAAAWGEAARQRLRGERDLRVVADTADERRVLKVVKAHRPAVLVVDRQISADGMLAVVAVLRAAHPSLRVLAITESPDDDFAVFTVRRGGHGVMAEEALESLLPKAVRCLAAGEAWLSRTQEAQVATALSDACRRL